MRIDICRMWEAETCLLEGRTHATHKRETHHRPHGDLSRRAVRSVAMSRCDTLPCGDTMPSKQHPSIP